MGTELIEAAERYLDLGLLVIALSGKMPNGRVHPHGLKDYIGADADEVQLSFAFRNNATTGIGILTGPRYYVVDIDGEEGAAAWKALVGSDYLPDRWVAKTGRGLHLWVAHEGEWPTAKLADKLDFKGIGGYVAAPPSIHPDGHRYEWLLEPSTDEPPLEFPPALLADLTERKALREQAIMAKQMRRPTPPEARIPGMLYAEVPSTDGIIAGMEGAAEGNRNAYLYWAAKTMAEDGASKDDFDRLASVARRAGLTLTETRRTIASALQER